MLILSNVEYFKIAGVILSLIGTIILAIRVTKILSILSLTVKMMDLNLQISIERAKGNLAIPPIIMYGNATHIDNTEKTGTKLLITGFLLQILGGIFNILSLLST